MGARHVAGNGTAFTDSELVERLRDELLTVCHDLVSTSSEKYRRTLLSYHDCQDAKDAHRWRDSVSEKIVLLASPPDAGEFWTGTQRIPCPLCAAVPSGWWPSDGFTIPTGLHRHLSAYTNVYACPVTNAAMTLAKAHWKERISGAFGPYGLF